MIPCRTAISKPRALADVSAIAAASPSVPPWVCARGAARVPWPPARPHATRAPRRDAQPTGHAPGNAVRPASGASATPRPARQSTGAPGNAPRIAWRGESARSAVAARTSRTGACAPPAVSEGDSANANDTRKPGLRASPTVARTRRQNGPWPGGAPATASARAGNPRSASVAGDDRLSRPDRAARHAWRTAGRRTDRRTPSAGPRDFVRAVATGRSRARRSAARAPCSRTVIGRQRTTPAGGTMPNGALHGFVPGAAAGRPTEPRVARFARNATGSAPGR